MISFYVLKPLFEFECIIVALVLRLVRITSLHLISKVPFYDFQIWESRFSLFILLKQQTFIFFKKARILLKVKNSILRFHKTVMMKLSLANILTTLILIASIGSTNSSRLSMSEVPQFDGSLTKFP